MTKNEEKTVLAMMRAVMAMTAATEKTSFAVQKERMKSLEDGFRSLGFDSASADRLLDMLYKKHIKQW